MKEKKFNLSSFGWLTLIIGGTFLALFIQEEYEEKKLNECQRVTIAYPIKFSGRSKIYYKFTLNGKSFEHGYTMPFPTMGKFERGEHLLKERFWIRVNCNDDYYNKIVWDVNVPDTLQYIPASGWDKIPYNLNTIE